MALEMPLLTVRDVRMYQIPPRSSNKVSHHTHANHQSHHTTITPHSRTRHVVSLLAISRFSLAPSLASHGSLTDVSLTCVSCRVWVCACAWRLQERDVLDRLTLFGLHVASVCVSVGCGLQGYRADAWGLEKPAWTGVRTSHRRRVGMWVLSWLVQALLLVVVNGVC